MRPDDVDWETIAHLARCGPSVERLSDAIAIAQGDEYTEGRHEDAARAVLMFFQAKEST